MTAVDTNQYDYEAFLTERSVRHNEQRHAVRAEAEQPFTEYDAYLEALSVSEPAMDAEEIEAEEKRQPWAETVANIRNYPEAWRPFVRRPQNGDWGAAS